MERDDDTGWFRSLHFSGSDFYTFAAGFFCTRGLVLAIDH